MDYELSHHVHTWRRVKPKVFFYIVTFRLFLQKKVGKILLGEFFDNFKTIISLALVKWVNVYSQLGPMGLVGYLSFHIQKELVE